MSGHHPFSELTKNLSVERRQRIDEKRKKLNVIMKFYETRQSFLVVRKGWEKELLNSEKHDFDFHSYRIEPLRSSHKHTPRLVSYRESVIQADNQVNQPHSFSMISRRSKPSDSSVTAITRAMYNTSFAAFKSY